MDSQIMYLKAVLLWLSWQLIWTRMNQNNPYKVMKLILMAVTPNVLDIKLLHYFFTIQPCAVYLDLLLWTLKTSPHMK